MAEVQVLREAISALRRDGDRWTYHDQILQVRSQGTLVAADIMPPDGDLAVRLQHASAELVKLFERALASWEVYPDALISIDHAVVEVARRIIEPVDA